MTTATDRERQEAREAEQLAVGPLLARAKLLLMRKQWDEAISVCTDALRKYPASVTARSLLGDLYEAQGRIDDAIQWYAMAVERDPDSASDRAKLERLQKVHMARRADDERQKAALKPVSSTPPRAKAATEKTIEKTIEWFDRIFPPGRSESIARLIFIVCGMIVVLLLIGTVVVYLFFLRERASALPPPTPTKAVLAQPHSDADPVVVTPSNRAEADTPDVQAVAPSVASPTAPSPSPVAAAPVESPTVGMDTVLRDGVARGLGGTASVISVVRRDAVSSAAEIEIPVAPAEPVEKTRERIVRVSFQAARALLRADGSQQRLNIQVALGGAAQESATPVPAFRGEIPLQGVRDLDPASADLAALLSRFRSSEWMPALMPSGAVNGMGGGSMNTPSPTASPITPSS
jgi:hypothetical protein